ncbi:hypothetical protein P9E76_11960 [Schinkia azotoformans]|uniref:Uncharacterized protein n=1 Tax=Schinkia azotoformans LMG 9581 TaxID=1131731 RepID=K6D3F1_SCHAZ|nr:hypothetical protein [Schinkia azotoformans]EKN62794.1 hypothetical protein BAZO_20293 [Schinkia azotoformans LMG 9581]MEC1639169.1 hypothetical protein [Schinkia azotoformans]MEC1945757.1 hypothetical protein [Schinkia azotoformans]
MHIKSVKYSINRKKCFQIKTTIFEDNGMRFVRKDPFTEESKSHIHQIEKNFHLLKDSNLVHVPPQLDGNKLIFQYVDGELLETRLYNILKKGSANEFIKAVQSYRSILLNENTIDFYETKQFTDIFGDGKRFNGMPAFKVSNIDLNFDNLILSNGKIIVIDYEWVFEFPIPVDYVIYRALNVLFAKYENLCKGTIAKKTYFELFDSEKIDDFSELEKNFSYYVGFEWFDLRSKYMKENVDLDKIITLYNSQAEIPKFLQVFWADNQNFSEEESNKIILNKGRSIVLRCELPRTPFEYLRIDPLNTIGYFSLDAKVLINNVKYKLDSSIVSKNNVVACIEDPLFDFISTTDDSQIIYKHEILKSNVEKTLEIKLEYETNEKVLSDRLVLGYANYVDIVEKQVGHLQKQLLLKEEDKKHINEQLQLKEIQIKELNEIIQQKENQIEKIEERLELKKEKLRELEEFNRAITSTRGWKALERFRKIVSVFCKSK